MKWTTNDELECLAMREEDKAKTRGGHHESLARMIRKAVAGFGPKTQLSLFPGSVKPKIRR
jgi:hypothetical protein